VIEKKCKFASKQSQPTWKPQRATQDAIVTKKGGEMFVLSFYEVFFILNSFNYLSIFNLDEVSFNSPFQFFILTFSDRLSILYFAEVSFDSMLPSSTKKRGIRTKFENRPAGLELRVESPIS